MFSFWVIIRMPYFATWAFLFGNVFAACGTTSTQPYFATWAFFIGNVFCCLWNHLDPILCFCYYVTCFLYFSYFLIFSNFASDVKAAASRTYGVQLCEKFWLTVFNSRADNTVINYCQSFCKFKAWCLLSSGEFSFLPATSVTVSLYLHYLLESSLGSSTIQNVFYAINWVHKLAGFDNRNPCDTFIVQSIVEASRRVPRKPVSKAEPITPEILGLIYRQYGESSNLLDIRFVCMCLLAYAGFFRISELLSIRRPNIVTEDRYYRILIEVSKTDKYREGSSVYIAKTGNVTCPYLYLIKYLEAARIPSSSQNYIFRSLRYDKHLKTNVLSSKPLTASRAGKILKEKLEAIGLDPHKFSNHSFRSGGATSAANLDLPDRLFKVHGRWKSDSANDGYVHDKVESRLIVPLHIGV